MNQQPAQGQPAMQLPHDVQGLLAKPFDWMFWGGVLLCALVVLCLVYFIYKKFLQKTKTEAAESLYETQVRRFSQLEYNDGVQGEQLKGFYFDISHILKALLEGYFEESVLDKTLLELRGFFKKNTEVAAHPEADKWLELFERAEQIKFAGASASSEVLKQDHQDMASWIEELDPNKKQTTEELKAK